MDEQIIESRFELFDKIGEGGMAVVYRARQKSLDRLVALKMLSSGLVEFLDFRERFLQEAKIIAHLTHPNIVQVHDILELGEESRDLCIVMEYLEGRPLNRVLAEQRPLPLARALAIGEQVAAGLAYAHQKKVIHRDIKPQNIMILEGDLVKIMDFGIARLAGSDFRTQTGATMGTPEFMSPEQAEGKPVDHRSDLYSLAVLLYTMVAGEKPFTAESPITVALKQVTEQPQPPSQVNPDIPRAVESVILKGMNKDPARRFQCADDFLVAMKEVSAAPFSAAVLESEPTIVLPKPRPRGVVARAGDVLKSMSTIWRSPRAGWLIGALGGLVVIVVLLIVVPPEIWRGRRPGTRPGVGKTPPPATPSPSPQRISPIVTPTNVNPTPGDRNRPPKTPAEVRTVTPTPPRIPTPEPTRTPAPTPAQTRPPGRVSLDPVAIERTMRRLNDTVAQDADKAKEHYQAATKIWQDTSRAWSQQTVSDAMGGFIDAVLHDVANWRYHSEFARFLLEENRGWGLPATTRAGLLQDAQELVRRARLHCSDEAERKKIADLEARIKARF